MRVLLAIAVSLAVHAILAGLLLVCVSISPEPDAQVTLDLSNVELSFSEREDESAAASSPANATSAPQQEILPPQELDAPLVAKNERAAPPDPHEMKFPEPSEKHPQVKTPPRPAAVATPEAAARPAPVQAQVTALPRPKRSIRPVYPKGARQRGEAGDVTLEISVDEHGACDAVRIVSSSGFAELDEAAKKAARAARFTPAKSGDRPVRSTARITLTFKLKEKG